MSTEPLPLTTDDAQPQSERAQTDESLRTEREKTDDALWQNLTAVDWTADAVITRARSRADGLVARARAMTDRTPGSADGAVVAIERAREDEVVRQERAVADQAVRAERQEHVATLAAERQETDKDLSSERARADAAVATRDEFLGVVSHDLRALLGTVVGFGELIERAVVRHSALDTVLAYARRIQRAGSRMDRLIGDLVDVASIDAGRLAVTREPTIPSQVAAEAVDTFQAQAATSEVSLTLEVESESSPVPLDPARILQVLTNLVLNALKFTPPGGRVVVSVAPRGDDLLFAVRDTGPGIPGDRLTSVFERFATGLGHERGGSGLGLYISKCIVEGHGGKIWAESGPGPGTTLSFTLPRRLRAD